MIGTCTCTTTAAGDVNSNSDMVRHDSLFGNFSPKTNLNFPATLTFWLAMGKKNCSRTR